jgi:hypothetical protein
MPLIGVVAWPLVILGLILSPRVQPCPQGGATNKGLAVTGIVLSAIGLVVLHSLACCFRQGRHRHQHASYPGGDHPLRGDGYEVTGDAKNVTISYTAYGYGISNSQESAIQLQAKGLLKGGSLTVTADADGGTVACKVVVVDGKQVKTGSASGPFATASCSDF